MTRIAYIQYSPDKPRQDILRFLPGLGRTDRPAPLLLESLSRFSGKKGPPRRRGQVLWPVEQRSTTAYYTPYTFSAKERDLETGYSYFGARYYDADISVWLSVDPFADKYPSMSAYMYCAGNPVKLIDPDGKTWKPTTNEETGEHIGFEWIDPEKSYNADGTLKDGLYEQAIFFSHNGTFNPDSKYNIGSSTATVYKMDGTKESIEACTYPSSTISYATVPAGLYEATVGIHRGGSKSYPALLIGKVELGMPNPNAAYNDGRTYATGVNVHKTGLGDLTGLTSANNPISAGCLLIKRDSWSRFIGIFNTKEQRNNTVGIIVSRSMSTPTNRNVPKKTVTTSAFLLSPSPQDGNIRDCSQMHVPLMQ